MKNSNGQTTLGFDKREILILIGALKGQQTKDMNDEGLTTQEKLIKRLTNAEKRLTTPTFWDSNPWKVQA
tara:strand:+ start:641 stop:850 length:210 start_codon:yes stop_codon:yes gene_type:complete